MESNPSNLEGSKEVIARTENVETTRQNLTGGGVVVTSQPMQGEYQQQQQEPQQQPQQQNYPIGAATTTTVRQSVRPSPTHNPVQKQQQQQTTTTINTSTNVPLFGGGMLGGFTSKSQSKFFFALHAGIAFFSFLVLVSAALLENNTANGASTRFVQYELLVGQLGFAVAIASCVMERVGLLENPSLRVALSGFQVFWWAPSLVIITFFGSFVSPVLNANGYFGSWGALIAAAVAFSHETRTTMPRADPRSVGVSATSLLVLFFSSLMIMGSAISLYNDQNSVPNGFTQPGASPYNYTVYAIAFGAVSAFLSLLLLVISESIPRIAYVVIGIVVFLWVVVGVLILTFDNPFLLAVGNGYYSSLIAVVASFGLLVSLRTPDREQNAARDSDMEASAMFFMFMRGLLISSLVVLIASSLVCRNDGGCNGRIEQYQIAVGAVSLGLTLIVVILEIAGLYAISSWIKFAFAIVLLGWWIAAFIVITWFGTFQSPTYGYGPGTVTYGGASTGPNAGELFGTNAQYANGFFFTWVSIVLAALAFAESLKDFARNADPPNPLLAKTGFLLVVMAGSAITLGSGITWYSILGVNNLTRYAIALGTVSLGWILILFVILAATRSNANAHDFVYNINLYLLTVWWAIGALVLTYQGLWTAATENGYFSVFFTLGACLLALTGFWRTDDPAYYDQQQNRNPPNRDVEAGTTTTATVARY